MGGCTYCDSSGTIWVPDADGESAHEETCPNAPHGYADDMRLTITKRPPADLPPVETLVAIIRDHPDRKKADRALTAAYRDIDAVTGVAGAAEWLNLAPRTIYSERSRKRADGEPRWPHPDETIERSPLWSWRTLTWHAAGMAQGFRKAAAQ